MILNASNNAATVIAVNQIAVAIEIVSNTGCTNLS